LQKANSQTFAAKFEEKSLQIIQKRCIMDGETLICATWSDAEGEFLSLANHNNSGSHVLDDKKPKHTALIFCKEEILIKMLNLVALLEQNYL